MIKELSLVLLFIAAVVLFSGCVKQEPPSAGDTTSGLDSYSKDLENAIGSSGTELDNELNNVPDIEPIAPEDLLAQSSGLEADESLLASENSLDDSLSNEITGFTALDDVQEVSPADLQ